MRKICRESKWNVHFPRIFRIFFLIATRFYAQCALSGEKIAQDFFWRSTVKLVSSLLMPSLFVCTIEAVLSPRFSLHICLL
jgi:hypothetical protein